MIDTEKYNTNAQHSVSDTQAFSFQLKLGSLTVLICGEREGKRWRGNTEKESESAEGEEWDKLILGEKKQQI